MAKNPKTEPRAQGAENLTQEKTQKEPVVVIPPVKPPEKPMNFNFRNVEMKAVEYFDDRFYKISLPAEGAHLVQHIPDNFRYPKKDNEGNLIGVDVFLPSVTTIIGYSMPDTFLSQWRGTVGNREADRITEEAKLKGKLIHDACQKFISGNAIVYTGDNINEKALEDYNSIQGEAEKGVTYISRQDLAIQVYRFARIVDILNPAILDVEHVVTSLYNFFYAGRLDYCWYLKGGDYKITSRVKQYIPEGKWIIDIKTGKSADYNYLIQSGAYTKAYEVEDIVGNIIIHLNSKNSTGIEGVKMIIALTDPKQAQDNKYKYLEPYWEQFKNLYRTFMFDNSDIRPDLFEFPSVFYRSEGGKEREFDALQGKEVELKDEAPLSEEDKNNYLRKQIDKLTPGTTTGESEKTADA